MRVLAIPGSLRAGSFNAALLGAAAEAAPEGVELVPFAGLRDLPHYDEDADVEPPDPAVGGLREAIASADALLIATPEYNGTMPGALKNAIDWASRPRAESVLRGKPAAVVGATTGGFGAVWAQADARKALGLAGARVIETGVAVPQADRHIDPDGALRTRTFEGQLVGVLEELREEVAASAAARVAS
jgi:chromate reductase